MQNENDEMLSEGNREKKDCSSETTASNFV